MVSHFWQRWFNGDWDVADNDCRLAGFKQSACFLGHHFNTVFGLQEMLHVVQVRAKSNLGSQMTATVILCLSMLVLICKTHFCTNKAELGNLILAV